MTYTFEIELQRNNVTPSQFLAYARSRVDSKGGQYLRSDLDLDYFRRGDDLNFDTWHEDDDELRGIHEKSVSKPYEMQTFISYPSGDKYNEICEFVFDDEKTGHGYYYLLNVQTPREKAENATEAVQDAETETEHAETENAAQPAEKAPETPATVPAGKAAVLAVSASNLKMGSIPSVSLPAVITCRKNAPCVKDCYARRMSAYRANVGESYQRNLNLYNAAPDLFFAQLDMQMKINRFFRLHVSGDFVNADYFARCAETVRSNPGCTVLAFTKQYEIVNAWIAENGPLPENFKVIFSCWGDWRPENPHGLPESNVIFPETEIPENWKICGGNCFECACRGCGCWELKHGETIGFYKH